MIAAAVFLFVLPRSSSSAAGRVLPRLKLMPCGLGFSCYILRLIRFACGVISCSTVGCSDGQYEAAWTSCKQQTSCLRSELTRTNWLVRHAYLRLPRMSAHGTTHKYSIRNSGFGSIAFEIFDTSLVPSPRPNQSSSDNSRYIPISFASSTT